MDECLLFGDDVLSYERETPQTPDRWTGPSAPLISQRRHEAVCISTSLGVHALGSSQPVVTGGVHSLVCSNSARVHARLALAAAPWIARSMSSPEGLTIG